MNAALKAHDHTDRTRGHLPTQRDTVSQFKVFKLYFCHRYALSHWLGDGFYLNNQTGSGTRTTFYRQDGSQIVSFTRGNQPPALVAYGWTPVWSIRNCE